MGYRCRECGEQADNRICRGCHERLKAPCTVCGAPTPTVTRMGKTARNTTCVACTASLKADTRRIGVTCRVCDKRSADTPIFYQVCPRCQAIETSCSACGRSMPKYRKKGQARETCSNRCRKVLHPTTSEQAKKAGATRFADHVYKSHHNRLARNSPDFKAWRAAVFTRDNYTCQDCGARSGNGKAINLHPHHLKAFATHHDLRFDVSNGVTLCQPCHRARHKHTFIGRSRRKAPGQLRLPTAG